MQKRRSNKKVPKKHMMREDQIKTEIDDCKFDYAAGKNTWELNSAPMDYSTTGHIRIFIRKNSYFNSSIFQNKPTTTLLCPSKRSLLQVWVQMTVPL